MSDSDNIIRAFSADHVIRLTGLSKGQLYYWDKTDFFRPRYAYEDRRVPYSRIYSFRDVVGLKTLAVLRKQHGISLQHLRDVARKLSDMKDDLWAKTKLYVLNKEVHFKEPDTRKVRGVVSGQYVSIPLVSIMSDVSREAEKLRERATEKTGKVERHRHIARNTWVVAGTRIPTGAIIQFIEAGYTIEQVLREYPSLTAADIKAALKHEKTLAKTA